jgi:hypothetical protein
MDMNWEPGWGPEPGRAKAWAVGTVAAILFGLLAAFVLVVSTGVRQGDQRRLERSVHEVATWRCNALRDKPARTGCLSQRLPPGSLPRVP